MREASEVPESHSRRHKFEVVTRRFVRRHRDLNSRRGQIQGTDSRGNAQVVEAQVPLANMFGYVNELRSFSQGRAQYTMQFSHYDEVPANVAEEVKAKLA